MNRSIFFSLVALTLGACGAEEVDAVSSQVAIGQPVPLATNDLALEALGDHELRAEAYSVKFPQIGDATVGFRQFFFYRDFDYLFGTRTTHLRMLDLTPPGTISASLDLTGVHEVHNSVRQGTDRLFLGTNAPAGALRYDRVANAFTNLGNPFIASDATGVFSMDEAPHGKIAFGELGREVSLLDPATPCPVTRPAPSITTSCCGSTRSRRASRPWVGSGRHRTSRPWSSWATTSTWAAPHACGESSTSCPSRQTRTMVPRANSQ